jgi:predicted transcriptional regulator
MFTKAADRLLQNCFLRNGLLLPERYYSMLRMREVSDRNRSKFEIIAEILRELRKPTGRTNIMSHCNMSSMQSGDYLSLMKSNDLVRIDTVAGKVTYQRTEAGLEFLKIYNEIVMLLDSSISASSLI